ncbi:MAG: DUF4143 domain-containing protein [Spirochaetia bacterium]
MNIGELERFERFLSLAAGRTGQILNYSSLTNDCGIALDTAKRWISVLKAGFIIFLLPLHHRMKPPIYFWRDRTGHEIDLLLDEGGKLFPVEIKSGQTVSPNMFNSLNSATLVYSGTDFQTRHETTLRPWFSL